MQTSQILEPPGSLVAAGLKERLKSQLWSRGIVSIQQKQCSDRSMAVQVNLSRMVALIMNTLLGTSQREGINPPSPTNFARRKHLQMLH